LRAEASVNVEARSLATLECSDRWLVVRFSRDHDVSSWAPYGGGVRRASAVAWYRVGEGELRPPVDAKRWLERKMREASLSRAVGLMTSRRLDAYDDVRCEWGSVSARAVATVGLGNALRAGDPPGPAGHIGTINVLCQVSVGLSAEALIEALAIAVEARTTAVLETGITSGVSGAKASGTGTDCVVIAAPSDARPLAPYAGKHTPLGHVIGASVERAVAAGATRWLGEKRA
jgi:adenosylcobinamide amidohydrolase